MTLYATGWRNVELRPQELADKICQGIAYSAQLSGGRRNTLAFLASDIVSVDVDGGLSLEDARARPIVRDHATIIYTTASHQPDAHRFRIIFALPYTITNPSQMRRITRSLALRLSGDTAVADPARLFFGSSGGQVEVFDRQIDHKLLQDLLDQAPDQPQSDRAGTPGLLAPGRSNLTIPPRQLIKLADGTAAAFSSIKARTAVHCPIHADKNASAFVVRSKAGTPGIHCSTCAVTYWQSGSKPPGYDFFDFDRTVKEASERDGQAENLAPTLGARPCNSVSLAAVRGRPNAAFALGYLGVVTVQIGVDNLRKLGARRALESNGTDEKVGPVRHLCVVPKRVPQDTPLPTAAFARELPDRPGVSIPYDW